MTGSELEILKAIQSLKCPFLDAMMPAISSLCNFGVIWIITAVLLLCFKKTRKWGVTLAIALIICVVLNNALLKNIIARERPYTVDPTIKLIIKPPHEYSFPSGHTLTSFAAATALMYHDAKRLGAASLALAVIMGFSRLYLQVHFPSDVLGGAVIGIFFAFIALSISEILIPEMIRRKSGNKRASKEKEN